MDASSLHPSKGPLAPGHFLSLWVASSGLDVVHVRAMKVLPSGCRGFRRAGPENVGASTGARGP